MNTIDNTMEEYDDAKMKQVIMSLIGNKISKEKMSKKKGNMVKEMLRNIPFFELRDFVNYSDKGPYYDVNGIFDFLLRKCGNIGSSKSKKVKRPRVANFSERKPDEDGVWRAKDRSCGMHRQRTRKEWGSVVHPARIDRQ